MTSRFMNLKFLTSVSLLVMLCLYFYLPIETEDIWWHLKTGEYIFHTGHVPYEDIFSFSNQRTPWVFTQWIGSAIYFFIYAVSGLEGLKIFRVLLILSAVLIFVLYSRRFFPTTWLLFLVFLLADALEKRALLRPLLFNFIFIQIMLMALFHYQRTKNWRAIVWLPLLGALWFNIHLGSFMYGLGLIGIFLFAMAIENRFEKRILIHLTSIIILYCLSFFINPYGLKGALYPWKVIFFPDFIGFYSFFNSIAELLPPIYLVNSSGIWLGILFFLTIIFLLVNNRHQFTYWILFACASFYFIYGQRGVDFFALVSLYLITQSAININFIEKWETLKTKALLEKGIYFIILLLILLGIRADLNQKVYQDHRLLNRFQQTYGYPNAVKAVGFLKQHHMKGLIFNTDSLGGYLIWEGYPGLKPFMDGRQVNTPLFYEYLKIMRHPAELWPITEQKYDIKMAMIDTGYRTAFRLVDLLSKDRKWQLVFIDGSIFIFVRRGAFDLPQEILQFEGQLKSVPVAREDVVLLKKIASSEKESFVKSIVSFYPFYIDTLEEGATLFGMGYQGAGLKKLLEGFRWADPSRKKQMAQAALKYLVE